MHARRWFARFGFTESSVWGKGLRDRPAGKGRARSPLSTTMAFRMYNPLNQFYEFFDDSGPSVAGKSYRKRRVPAVDLYEKKDFFEVAVSVPGIHSDSIEVDYDATKHLLTISGQVGDLKSKKPSDEGTEERNVRWRERWQGRFTRAISVPHGIQDDAVSARLNNGVLTVILPKVDKSLKRTRRIEVDFSGNTPKSKL